MSKPVPRAIATRLRKNERRLRAALDFSDDVLADFEADPEQCLAYAQTVRLLAEVENWQPATD